MSKNKKIKNYNLAATDTQTTEITQGDIENESIVSRQKIYCCFCILQRQSVFWLNMFSLLDCAHMVFNIVVGSFFDAKSESSKKFIFDGS